MPKLAPLPPPFVLEFPYKRTLGPVLGRFMTALRDGRILGIRCGGRVLCPPMEFNPETGETLSPDFVDVGPSGRVENWTWIAEPTCKHPFQEPFAFALVKLDGADTAMVHAVKAAGLQAMSTGMRVKAQFREERVGAITDVYFVPEAEARDQAIEAGKEEVKITQHIISLTYHEPLFPHKARYAQGLLDGKFIGQRSPASGRISIPSRGYDPIARVRMTEADDAEVGPAGTIISYTVVAPVKYHGQKEKKRYISATIFLDGADQALPNQSVRNISPEDVRLGMRVRAIFKPPEERNVDKVDNDWMYPTIGDVVERWEPTGEPDVPSDKLPESI
jgi:uncharacterized protein